MSHTTERWFAEGGTVLDENRLPVAHVVGQEEDNSDALLIAQAPAMAAVLRDVWEWAQNICELSPDQARAVLYDIQEEVGAMLTELPS